MILYYIYIYIHTLYSINIHNQSYVHKITPAAGAPHKAQFGEDLHRGE